MHIASKPVSNSGGLEGIRTLDPYNANVVRSQLRYKPVWENYITGRRFVKDVSFCKKPFICLFRLAFFFLCAMMTTDKLPKNRKDCFLWNIL